ncbi:MAG: type II toxin-antitoxin system VapC family toxin [Acidobacteriota bacterium]
MILPDVNLLIYAHDSAAPHHETARDWWSDALSGRSVVGLPWVVVLGYVRLVTHRRVLVRPLSAEVALSHVRAWMDRPQVQVLQPGPRHVDLLESLAEEAGTAGGLTTDLHLAALAIEHRCELCSNDADFGRFSGLLWRNPLR